MFQANSSSTDSALSTQHSALSRWERLGLVGLLVVAVLYGGWVEFRSAFLTRRMTDVDVYLRAAWAVRAGEDFYKITDDNGWHYHYPPFFAILLTPLADPPAGADRAGTLPFAVSVALWYVFSVLCLLWAVHWWASTLEQVSSNPAIRNQPRGCRRWWALRVVPALVCLSAVAHTLMRGQVNHLLLLVLAGTMAAWTRGRRWQAGLWLAGAICIKIIPAFLLLYPVWRRDWRCLAGCTLGLILGLGVIPALVFGPAQTLAYYREWDEAVGRPGLGDGKDQSRAHELTEVTATDSQSYLAVLHNSLHLDRWTRPPRPSWPVRWAHWLLGSFLTGVTLLAAGRRPLQSGSTEVLFFGALAVMMVLLSPVCHLHYFCLALPLVMGLMAATWEKPAASQRSIGLWLLLGTYLIANTLPSVPGLEVLRDLGLAMYAALLLWLVASAVLWRRSRLSVSSVPQQPGVANVAA